MGVAERLAAIPALAVAIAVWNTMGYPLWMILVASAAILGVFFPKQGKAVLKALLAAVKKVSPPLARLLWRIVAWSWREMRINRYATPTVQARRASPHLRVIK